MLKIPAPAGEAARAGQFGKKRVSDAPPAQENGRLRVTGGNRQDATLRRCRPGFLAAYAILVEKHAYRPWREYLPDGNGVLILILNKART